MEKSRRKFETRCEECNALIYFNDSGRDYSLPCPTNEDCGEDGDF